MKEVDQMIEELLRLYEESRLNRGQPECLLNPTLPQALE
jgi:hypothetical protein